MAYRQHLATMCAVVLATSFCGVALAKQGETAQTGQSVKALLATWPAEARVAAQSMIETHGQPQEVTDTALVWTIKDRQAFLDIERRAVQAEATRYAETGASREAGQ